MSANDYLNKFTFTDLFFLKKSAWLLFFITLILTTYITYRLHLEHELIYHTLIKEADIHVQEKVLPYHTDMANIVGTLSLFFNTLFLTIHLAFIRNRKKLKEQQDTVNNYLNIAGVMIMVLDNEKNIILMNPRGCEMMGYTAEELIGKNFIKEFVPKRLQPDIHSVADSLIQKDLSSITHIKNHILTKSGEERLIKWTNTSLLDEKKNIIGILSSGEDITDSELYNQHIIKTTQMLKEAQKLSKLGSWQLDLTTYDLEWSDEIYEIFELTSATHTPNYDGFLNAIHPEDRELVNSTYTSSVENHTSYNYVHRLLMPDGRVKYVREQGQTFYADDGTPLESRGTVHDVTDQKELEKTLQEKNDSLVALTEDLLLATKAAKSANQVKTNFLANMSHEIRTPLNGVIGLTDLVLQTDLQPMQRDYLMKAQTASQALLSILNSILDYSKIEAHMLTFESVPFNIHEILYNTHALFAYIAQEKQVSLEIDHDDTVPHMIVGDPLRVQQILTNLVGNAIKFTKSGYVRISISATPYEGRLKLAFDVSDSGIGMSADQQTKLFQPFSQVDASFTRKFGGTGLGLMITKELVELMGGEITVQSSPNQGSTFSFTLLFDLANLKQSPASQTLSYNEHRTLPTDKAIHLLLVEDNDLNQIVASERLKQMGITCSIANNGLEAVEMVQKEVFDAVLMDLQMPVMDGLEATQEIRKLPGYEKLPIIALSAAVLQDDLTMALDAGMNDHIAKPIDKVILQDVLAKWLSI